MSKVSYNERLAMKQKDLERQFWEVIWAYTYELGMDESEEKKDVVVKVAQTIIPQFAESMIEHDLYFDYPTIYLLLTSVYNKQNILGTKEIRALLKAENEMDGNSRLAVLVEQMKSEGLIWQSQ